MIPYPSWLSPGDNAWQLLAATLVGLMSIPGVALLYGGLVQRKWAVNTLLMVFSAFSLVLVVWVLWGFNMGFGQPLRLGSGWLSELIGRPAPIVGAAAQQKQAGIPLLSEAMPQMRFSQSSLAYFHFAFAAITPVLFLGAIVGRMSFRAWLLFVPLWSTLVYTVNAFLLWGGGFWAHKGALDYSGGYVIHLAAGTSGFVAAAVIGPRLARDRAHGIPNNLFMVAAGAGILWLGWNGFNGGDMYFAGHNAALAVLNTNLATAVALLTWLVLDMTFSSQRRPTFLGAVNGMISGLVAITPAAGFVDGVGAILIGLIASVVVWLSWNKLGRRGLFRRVDDALGVFHTHGVAGLTGGLLVGLFANPKVLVYLGVGENSDVAFKGLFYGNPKQVLLQAGAAATVIVWDAVMTFLILRAIGVFVRLRLSEEELESGDIAVHDEEVYPPEAGVTESVRPRGTRHASVMTAPESPRTGVRVRLTRGQEPDESPYVLLVDLPRGQARFPVQRQTRSDDPYVKETYEAELLGSRIQRGNLVALEKAIRETLTKVVPDGDVPLYVLRGPDDELIPVFKQGRALRAHAAGRWIEGQDVTELRTAVVEHLAMRRGQPPDLTMYAVTPENLTGTEPTFAFNHREVWVPVFARPWGALYADVAGQEIEARADLPGVLKLRREVGRLLRDTGRLYDPLDLVVTGVARHVWSRWVHDLEPSEEITPRRGNGSLPGYRVGDVSLTATTAPGNTVTLWFGRDRFHLTARIEAATRDLTGPVAGSVGGGGGR